MNRKKMTVIILVIFFLTVAGVLYKAGRPGIRISRTDFPRWSRTELSESSEAGADERTAASEEPDANIIQNQAEEPENLEEAADSEPSCRVYANMAELRDNRNLPYVDEEVFGIIKAAYLKVDFEGEFDKGNPDIYKEYREIFQRLVRNEAPYLDRKTGEETYLKDCTSFGYSPETAELESFEYIFFDIEGDGMQELFIRNSGRNAAFKYDPEEEKIISWHIGLDGSDGSWGPWETLIGTGKVQNNILMKDFNYYQYDESEKKVCSTTILFQALNSENMVYLVRIPEYADREGEEVPEKIKSQGSFEQNNEKWYFRVTKEQYEELLQLHWDAYEAAEEKIKEVTYTYEKFLE